MMMELFNLDKLELYSPGNKVFLRRSVELLREEMLEFDTNLNKEWKACNQKGIRQVVHKMRPSVELFRFPVEYAKTLNTVYDFDENFTDHKSFQYLVEKINIFTTRILEELNTYLKLNP